jgi:hypothetical protein
MVTMAIPSRISMRADAIARVVNWGNAVDYVRKSLGYSTRARRRA